MTPRGSETWSSESSLLVTQAGFPEGRSTLPTDGTGEVGGGTGSGGQSGQLEFADPDRLSGLASLYAQLATGDRVRARLPEHPKASQIEAIPVEGNASIQLPVIKLTTSAGSGPRARALNVHTVQALTSVLESEQTKNAIPAGQRIRITQINAPALPDQDRGPLSHGLDTRSPAMRARRGCARASPRRAARRARGHGVDRRRRSCRGVSGDLSDTPDMEPMPAGGRRFCAGPDRLALRQAPGTVSSRVAVLPAPGLPGRGGRSADQGAGTLDHRGAGGAGCARRGRRSRPGQPDPRRGRRAAGVRGLPPHAALVADHVRPADRGDPVHPDPPLHGRGWSPRGAGALPVAHGGRAGLLAVRRLRRPGGALAAHGTRGADPHGHRRDPRLAGA